MDRQTVVTLQNLISKIEGSSFLAESGTSSTFNVFLRILHDSVKGSNWDYLLLPDLITVTQAFKDRLRSFLEKESDLDKLNPYDRIIASYMILIAETNKSDIETIIKLFKRYKKKNLWWSNFALRHIIFMELKTVTKRETIRCGEKKQDILIPDPEANRKSLEEQICSVSF